MKPTDTLLRLQTALDTLRQSGSTPAEFCQLCREQTDLVAALPPKFGDVLNNLLDRLESSALFAEESCSFSHKDLYDSLQLWLDKAKATLAA